MPAARGRPPLPSASQRHLVIYTVDCFFAFCFYKKQLELSTLACLVNPVGPWWPAGLFLLLFFFKWWGNLFSIFIHFESEFLSFLNFPASFFALFLIFLQFQCTCCLVFCSFLRLIFALLLFPACTHLRVSTWWGGGWRLSLPLPSCQISPRKVKTSQADFQNSFSLQPAAVYLSQFGP